MAFADEIGSICEETLDTHVCKVRVIQIRQEKERVTLINLVIKKVSKLKTIEQIVEETESTLIINDN